MMNIHTLTEQFTWLGIILLSILIFFLSYSLYRVIATLMTIIVTSITGAWIMAVEGFRLWNLYYGPGLLLTLEEYLNITEGKIVAWGLLSLCGFFAQGIQTPQSDTSRQENTTAQSQTENVSSQPLTSGARPGQLPRTQYPEQMLTRQEREDIQRKNEEKFRAILAEKKARQKAEEIRKQNPGPWDIPKS